MKDNLGRNRSYNGDKHMAQVTCEFISYGEHRKGYLKALVDLINWLEGHSEAMKRERLYHESFILALLKAWANNLDIPFQWGEHTQVIKRSEGKGAKRKYIIKVKEMR